MTNEATDEMLPPHTVRLERQYIDLELPLDEGDVKPPVIALCAACVIALGLLSALIIGGLEYQAWKYCRSAANPAEWGPTYCIPPPKLRSS